MADQTPDGTITADRHNKLMSAYQRALATMTPEQREAFKTARPDAPDAPDPAEARADAPDAVPPEARQEQGSWEPGTRLVVDDDGSLVEVRPSDPQNPNRMSHLGRDAVWADKYGPKDDDNRTAFDWVPR